jgi:hypothetical protein
MDGVFVMALVKKRQDWPKSINFDAVQQKYANQDIVSLYI